MFIWRRVKWGHLKMAELINSTTGREWDVPSISTEMSKGCINKLTDL